MVDKKPETYITKRRKEKEAREKAKKEKKVLNFGEMMKEDIKVKPDGKLVLEGVKDSVQVGKVVSSKEVYIKKLHEKEELWNYIIVDELDKKHKGHTAIKEVIFLCCIGRLVKNKKPFSFNALISAGSSSGKDHLIASVLKIFPERDIETFGRISARALNYMHTIDTEPDYNYEGKIIYLKEIEEKVLNNEVMLEFTSGEEEISKVAITKQKGAGVDIKEIRGHPEVFCTSAKSIPNEEIRNRFNIIGLDTSEEQIERTFIQEEDKYDESVMKILKDLKVRKIKIPEELFNFIKKAFPKSKVRYQRDFQKLLDFVKAIALFHNRKVAEPKDYNKAKDIFMNAYSGVSDIPLKDIDRRIVRALKEEQDNPISAKTIMDKLGGIITIASLYNHLRNLVSKEILNELTDRTVGGYVVTNYVLSEEFKDKKPFILPNYEES